MATGYQSAPNAKITGESNLFVFDCTALKNDGSLTTLNITINNIEEAGAAVYTYTTVNGTFTTLDEVAPTITITSPAEGATVPQDVAVTATITDVGGVDQSTISITVDGVAITSPTITPIAGGYMVSGTATSVPLGTSTVVVSASDTSGNPASVTRNIIVAESGITFDPNLDGIFTNKTQPVISARYVEVTGVRMFLDGIDVTANTTTPSSGVITLDYSSYGPLADGEHNVVVNGTSTIDSSVLSATETFTKDTVLPVVVVTGISDSDGDGYPEANEDLTIAYTVTDANPDQVWIGSASNTSSPGTLVYGSAQGNTLGNRNATLTAVDKAGNSNTSSPFHIYNNYLAYIDEPSAGTFAGLDLTKTAAYNVFTSEVAQAISISGGAGQMNLPTLGVFQKQVTAGSGVVVDNRANDDIPPGTFPTGAPYFVAPSGGTLNFAINVPNIDNATIIIGMANSSFVDQVLRGGSSSVSTSSLEQALSKEKIVIYGKGGGSYGYKFVRITGSTATDLGGSGGFTFNTDLPTMIRANSYDLSAGFNTVTHGLGLPIGYGQTQLGPGEYVIMAITLDNDRVAAITAMPFVVTEEASQFSTSADMYSLGDPVVVNWGGVAAPQNAAAVLIREGSTYTGNVTLDLTTLGTGSLQSMYLLGDGNETVKILYSGANVWISEGYGNAARAANAATLNIPTSDLLSGTYRVHMLAENGGNLTAYGSTSVQLFAGPVPTPQPTTPPSVGGGGGRGGFAPETGSSSLLIGSEGKLLRPYTVRSPSGITELNLPLGTYAVDADGNPLSEVSIDDLDPADLPAVPAGAAYTFAGHAVVCSPSGARFDPAISLVFTFNADQWSEIMQAAEYDASSLVVKWYDEEAGEWETVPTVVDPATRTLTASVEHFTVFGLFVEPGAVTPVVTPTTPIVTPTTPTTTTPVTPPAEEFPWTYVVIAVVIILVIAIGVYYYTRKP